MQPFLPVILSGGSGTRMWPYSRSAYPKQLLPLVSDNTMLQDTLVRLSGMQQAHEPIVICNEQHRFLVAEQLRDLDYTKPTILLEPFGRNTAPAITLAALSVDPEQILLILPADHVIGNLDAFHAALYKGIEQASFNKLATFGIIPSHAETGYGYIKAGKAFDNGTFKVDKFVEKPNLKTAQTYLQSGDYSWNSGMFVFKAGTFLEELANHQPEILHHCKQAFDKSNRDLDFIRIDPESFANCPDTSIDYAVMEKTDNAVVIPIDVNWNDVGSWSALWEVSPKDDKGNTLKGDIIAHETENCFIQNNGKLIATLGISDSVVIETDDAILVAAKNRVQEVKTIVKQLKQDNRKETQLHRKVFRPWGYYDSIENGKNFQVKRLAVYPQAKLSLQKHQHRAEHWVVVSGVAEVTNGDEVFRLEVNQSTYIPQNTVHRLSNPTDTILEVIEVQTGSYLGEDDIERLDDIYSRHNY